MITDHGQPHAGGDADPRTRDARIFLRNLEDLAARTRPGQPVTGLGEIEGTDASGVVRCRVDIAGRLLRLDIDEGWWETPGPARVATAILDAVRFTKSKASMARMTLERYGHQPVSTATDLGSVFAGQQPSEPLPDWADPDLPRALARKLDRTFTILDGAARFSHDRDEPGPRVVAGPHGLFRLVLNGPEIVAAEVNESILHSSDGPLLADDARAVLRATSPTAPPAHAGRHPVQEER